MINLIEKIQTHIQSERKSWAPACNYASSSGHPCSRNLVYQRLNWQEKALPNPRTLMIFREGNMHEKAIMTLLAESGIEVVEQQRPFEWPELQVRGRVDGRVKENGSLIPLEVKSMNSFEWEKINSVEDMRSSHAFWTRGYYDQFQLYLFMSNESEGIILLKNKQTGEPKQLNVKIDYEYAEKIAKKLEAVNKHVKEKTYPDRITDKAVCQYCDFRHICLPDEASASINILENADLLELLEAREQLKEAAKNYEQADKKIKYMLERTPEGTHLVGGKYQVKIQMIDRKFANVPDDIKKQYEEVKTTSRITITALK